MLLLKQCCNIQRQLNITKIATEFIALMSSHFGWKALEISKKWASVKLCKQIRVPKNVKYYNKNFNYKIISYNLDLVNIWYII